MLEIFAPALWVCFTVYTAWYLTSAENNVPITIGEAKFLWKIHRQNIRCNARKWREIQRRGKIVGFECECGYRHIQKRPIIGFAPVTSAQQQTSTFDKLHTSYKSA